MAYNILVYLLTHVNVIYEYMKTVPVKRTI